MGVDAADVDAVLVEPTLVEVALVEAGFVEGAFLLMGEGAVAACVAGEAVGPATKTMQLQ